MKMRATINSASVDKKLRDWEQSAAGEKTMQNKVAEYIISGKEKTDAGSDVTTLGRVRELAEDLKTMIVGLSSEVPRSVSVNIQSLSAGDATLDDGRIELVMEFTDDLSRPSLDREKYPEGVANIVAIFDKGYSAKGSVFGEWHGELVWSLRSREGLGFMERAVSTFNSLYGPKWGIRAELQGPYA